MAKKNKKAVKEAKELSFVKDEASVLDSNPNELQNDVALAEVSQEVKTVDAISVPGLAIHKPAPKRRWVKKSAIQEAEPEEVRYEAVAFEDLPKTKKKKKRKLTLSGKKALSGWLFCLPFVIGIVGIYLPIVIRSIEVSFLGRMGDATMFTFDAYKHAFTEVESGMLVTTIVNSMKDLIIQIPAIVIFSLFMAIILNQKMTGRTFFRAVFFLPVILSTGIIDAINTQINASNIPEGTVDDPTAGADAAGGGGLMSSLDMEMLLSSVNLKFTLGSKTIDLVAIVTELVNNIFKIVSRSGVQMLIFLSGLQSISPSIYESCQMEGATAWETFWKITLPMISPMILVNAIYTVVDLFTAADNTVVLALKGYGQAFIKNPGSYSAVVWVYTALSLVVIVIVALLLRTVVFYQRKD